jgi:outer membrane protein OmpA-like peptidoglycan-associated protein
MIKRLWVELGLVMAMVMLAGCAGKPERIVLLPQEGRATALVVTGPSGRPVTLSEPYAEAVVGKRETLAGKTDADSVGKRYGPVLSATPMEPRRFTLYFVTGGNEFTAESAALVPKVVAEIAAIPAVEVIVIGHTDRVGALEFNDSLSLRRAQVVRDRLIDAGVSGDKIVAAGRGERDPVVQTADEVSEPRNRRVEVKVR